MSSPDDSWRDLVRARAEALLALHAANRAMEAHKQQAKRETGSTPRLLLSTVPDDPRSAPWFKPIRDPDNEPYRWILSAMKAGVISREEVDDVYR